MPLHTMAVLEWIILGGTLAFCIGWLIAERIVASWRSPRGFYQVVTKRRAKYISLFDRSDPR